MSKPIIIFLIIFIAVLIQISFLPNLAVQGAAPNLILVIIIFWATRFNFERIWPWAALSGLMLDLAYFWPVGINIFSFTFIAYGTNYLTRRFLVAQSSSRFFILAGILILGAASNDFITNALLKIFSSQAVNFKILFFSAKFAVKIVYDLSLFAIIYIPLLKLEKNIAPDELRPKPVR